jgi:hypothetical protein
MIRADMGPDAAFGGHPAGSLAGHCQALLAQIDHRGLQVASRFLQGLFTIHHPSVGPLTQGFYQFGSYLQIISP